MNTPIRISNSILIENFTRMKVLSIVFLSIGVFNSIINFTSINPWNEIVNGAYKIIDVIFSVLNIFAVAYFWFSKKENYSQNTIAIHFVILYVILWSILICGIFYTVSGFSTYVASLILILLYLHFKPNFFIPLIWISSVLLLLIIYFSPYSQSEFFSTFLMLLPISIVSTLLSLKNYSEKLKSLQHLFENEDLTKKLQIAKDNLTLEVEKKTKSLVDINASLQIAKEKAEESDKLKSAFLANMSHEIRTPLNGIMGFISLLESDNLSSEKQKKYIKIIQKSSERLFNTINDIIDVSFIDSNQVSIRKSSVNISDMLKNFIEFYKEECISKNIDLSLDNSLMKTQIILNTDASKVTSIFSNLIKNAIKYTIKGSIIIGSQFKDTFIEFYIKDTGIGIPKNRQDAIFERFVQADIEDKLALQGSGLGLAIVKSYVKMLGGNVWVTSEVNKGSTFYFTLPL